MPVEKINVSQPVQSVPIVEKETEDYDKPTQRTSGSSKDVVTALSALAAVGAAGVAVYKHKEAKKLVADAENAAKKQIEEANAKLKKAEEEIEKKIKDAVDKVKEEYEKKTEKTDNIKTKVDSVRSYMSKLAKKVRNRFKKDTPKTEKTKEPEKPVKKAEKEKTAPVKEAEAEKVSLKKRISTYIDETAYVIYSKGINYAKKFKRIMTAKPKEVVEPEIISEAAESEVADKITLKTKALTAVKKAFGFVTEKFRSFKSVSGEKPKEAVEPEIISEAAESEVAEKITLKTKAMTAVKKVFGFVTEKFRSFRSVSGEKPKEVVEPEIIFEAAESEVAEKITLKTKAMTAVKKASDFVTEKFRSLRSIFSRKNNVPEEITEESAKITDPPLISEIIEPSGVEKIFDEGANKGIKEIEKEAHIDFSIKKPNSEITQDIQQAGDDELDDILTRNVFKGIKIPEVRDISEQNLITEYNAFKNIVENLPVADSASKRFLEIKGELINHRGYYITADGQLIKKPAK